MDLPFNAVAPLARDIVDGNMLQSPFVLVDVGVQGGHSPRWDVFGDLLIVHGFDPLPEVIEALRMDNAGNPKRAYYDIALSDANEGRRFFVNPEDACSSSLFSSRENDEELWVDSARLDGMVPRPVPQPDFIKIDVEGAERFVLDGAAETLKRVIGVEIETNFNASEVYPLGHFPTIHGQLNAVGLRLIDVAFDRDEDGRLSTFNALFCRDVTEEVHHPDNYANPALPLDVDQLLKLAVIFESYNLEPLAMEAAAWAGYSRPPPPHHKRHWLRRAL